MFIRHGSTAENLERRYASGADVPLDGAGVREAEVLAASGTLPRVDALFCAPALRCRQTAQILFPGLPFEICAFAEMDFGAFAGKNADDLTGDKVYAAWLETGCTGDIPGGGGIAAFKARCRAEFSRAASASAGTAALCLHGGNIMAVMEAFAAPKKNFFEYGLPNCGFILCRCENMVLTLLEKRFNVEPQTGHRPLGVR